MSHFVHEMNAIKQDYRPSMLSRANIGLMFTLIAYYLYFDQIDYVVWFFPMLHLIRKRIELLSMKMSHVQMATSILLYPHRDIF